MLYLFFTADHEMYFGENWASEYEVFIDPTYRLMGVLERYDIPLCLMTDVCSMLRYRELRIERPYVSQMNEQIISAIKRGHDVQLHIHPHWMTSDYVDGRWRFDSSHYSLHKFGFTDNDAGAKRIIREGKEYLENLIKPVDDTYECMAFRAGGWCLQPEKEFIEALLTAGIKVDTTVFYGGYRKTDTHYYDFRRVPPKTHWWINPRQGLNCEGEKDGKNMFEVTIGSYQELFFTPLKKLKHKYYRMKTGTAGENPLGSSIEDKNASVLTKMMDRAGHFLFQPIMFSFDNCCVEVMVDMLDHFIKRYKCWNNDNYICIVGHPKTLNNKTYREINEFCKTVIDNYSKVVKFHKLSEIQNLI
ncbi:MAG: hypothetical protein HPY50_06655 [Firmicutes bacterium]|nr:hypothetical protein [Bacillota bacterium]